MAQEIHHMVRQLTAGNVNQLDQEVGWYCRNGYKLFNTHHIGVDRKDGSHTILYILVKEIPNGPVSLNPPKRGRPAKEGEPVDQVEQEK